MAKVAPYVNYHLSLQIHPDSAYSLCKIYFFLVQLCRNKPVCAVVLVSNVFSLRADLREKFANVLCIEFTELKNTDWAIQG